MVALHVGWVNRILSVVRETGGFDLSDPFPIVTRRVQVEDSGLTVVRQDGMTVAVLRVRRSKDVLFHGPVSGWGRTMSFSSRVGPATRRIVPSGFRLQHQEK
jgi:hypothetical protein